MERGKPCNVPPAPQEPRNKDDDEDVEEWKDKMEARKRALAWNAELARTALLSREALISDVVDTVCLLVQNVPDSCYRVNSCHLFTPYQSEAALGILAGTTVIFCTDQARPADRYSDEARLFEVLTRDGYERHRRFSEALRKSRSVAHAIELLVQAGVKEHLVKSQDAHRLISLYQVWMRDVQPEDMEISWFNRPSLGSWEGDPESLYMIDARSLMRGVPKDRNVVARFHFGPIESLPVQDPKLMERITLIYSKDQQLQTRDLARQAIENALADSREKEVPPQKKTVRKKDVGKKQVTKKPTKGRPGRIEKKAAAPKPPPRRRK